MPTAEFADWTFPPRKAVQKAPLFLANIREEFVLTVELFEETDVELVETLSVELLVLELVVTAVELLVVLVVVVVLAVVVVMVEEDGVEQIVLDKEAVLD
jgi:hypothetical protein